MEPWEKAADTGTPEDYWVLITTWGRGYVSAETARAIEMALDQVPMPRWITLTDLAGSRTRVRTRDIVIVGECTAASRVRDRAFGRARKAEKKADGWNDDDE